MSERAFGRRPFDFMKCSTLATTLSPALRLDELQPTTATASIKVKTVSSGCFMIQDGTPISTHDPATTSIVVIRRLHPLTRPRGHPRGGGEVLGGPMASFAAGRDIS